MADTLAAMHWHTRVDADDVEVMLLQYHMLHKPAVTQLQEALSNVDDYLATASVKYTLIMIRNNYSIEGITPTE